MSLVAIAAAVAIAVVSVTWLLPDRAEAEDAAGGRGDAGSGMRVTDLRIPGPAPQGDAMPAEGAGLAINRIGSAEVPVRRYEPATGAWATLVWAHGGSFVHGGLDWPEADWVAREFAASGVRVYSVDYVLASDTVKAPAPANDVTAVLSWALAEHPDTPVAVGGASAGGHLATRAALDVVDAARPAALLLEYPTLHRAQQPSPEIAAATAQLSDQRRFGAERIASMYAYYLGEELADAETADTVPYVVGELPSERLAQLPPIVLVSADADDLRASAEQFADQARGAGVAVTQSIQPGTVHGYLNRPNESARALAAATDTVSRFVAELRRIAGS